MALTSNDRAEIQRMIADGYQVLYTDTEDATPVTVWSYQMTTAELITVEVLCRALSTTGTGGYVARIAKNFLYDGTTLTDTGAFWGYVTDEYIGTLSTCGISFATDGDTVSLLFTGEAATGIRANFKITVHNLVNTEVVLP